MSPMRSFSIDTCEGWSGHQPACIRSKARWPLEGLISLVLIQHCLRLACSRTACIHADQNRRCSQPPCWFWPPDWASGPTS
jgi:hypothetical protein